MPIGGIPCIPIPMGGMGGIGGGMPVFGIPDPPG